MPKRKGIKLLEPKEIKKKKPILDAARVGNTDGGFWCVRHQHWACKNGVFWRNDECRPAGGSQKDDFWCCIHQHWTNPSRCSPDCKEFNFSKRNDMPVELL